MNRSTPQPETQSFLIARFVFFRLLGLTCLIACWSLFVQIVGLVGERGILPISSYLQDALDEWGWQAIVKVPTLFWLNSSDAVLQFVCYVGVALSALLLFGIATRLVLILLWVVYLSLFSACQLFLGFQWDVLLLETRLFSLFIAPRGWVINSRHSRVDMTSLARFAMWWLIFKLMFLSGITKLLSGDETWRDLTAMNYHYFTQPLPNPISWFVYQLPEWFHKLSTIGIFVIELIIPLFIFMPRLLRHIGAFSVMALQVVIGLTGNFGFFNLLTFSLCVLLLDDRVLSRLIPGKLKLLFECIPRTVPGFWKSHLFATSLSILLVLSGLKFFGEMARTSNPARNPVWVTATQDLTNRYLMNWVNEQVFSRINRFGSINGYGLFRVMTIRRPEIVIEYSVDGERWEELVFRYKPVDMARRPAMVAPHMPRLDWQMWFAALDPPGNQYWLDGLLVRLAQRSRPVLQLFDPNVDLNDARYLRMILYHYEFTSQDDATEYWWERTEVTRTPAIAVDELKSIGD